MAENSKIQWTDHTFNMWRGCTKISPGCTNCYAEELSRRNPRVLGEWGPNGTRVIASEAYWRLPLRWDREAAEAGQRRRVFCASLADWLEDRPELIAPRGRLLDLIDRTPNLDWLLLSKRVDGWRERMQEILTLSRPEWADVLARDWLDGHPPANVWVGTSVEDDPASCRLYPLQDIPARVRFLSCEPLLGPIDFTDGPADPDSQMASWSMLLGIDWVIIGGESGGNARPCQIDWIRGIVRQCREEGVAVFVKQLGAEPVSVTEYGPQNVRFADASSTLTLTTSGMRVQERLTLRDRKGGDPDEWPEDLRIREFPTPRPNRKEGLRGPT